MQVLYSPQFNDVDSISYEFVGEKIICTLNGEVDEFDFTGLPEGILGAGYRENPIETTLAMNPISGAKRENGILYVTLLNFIGKDATQEERFPEWIEV
jgi:hypothetical protein